MSTEADERYEAKNDPTSGDVPSGDVKTDDYTESKGPIPVQSDDAPVEDPIDDAAADSNAQLGESSHCRLLRKNKKEQTLMFT